VLPTTKPTAAQAIEVLMVFLAPSSSAPMMSQRLIRVCLRSELITSTEMIEKKAANSAVNCMISMVTRTTIGRNRWP